VFKMNDIFWNSYGFKDPNKHNIISDLTKENNLNFIAISETGRSDFLPRFLKNICSERDYLWHSKALRGRSSGMLRGVDLQIFDILVLLMKEIIILNSIYATKYMNSSGC
jgi:hypothetical protein